LLVLILIIPLIGVWLIFRFRKSKRIRENDNKKIELTSSERKHEDIILKDNGQNLPEIVEEGNP
jgi:hypothetical protein